ncbi:MAG TPA: hypothetical protein VKZ85_11625 [Woeseiaceae bacterium]|nr:hypothetical protein [Woeseiaceae bacterium]
MIVPGNKPSFASRCLAAAVLAWTAGLVALPAAASVPAADSAAAIRALAEFEDACRSTKPLWSVDLCGPIVLVDPRTRMAVTNRPDPAGRFAPRDGAFVGEWPADMPVANTSIDWEDTRWAMILLPLPEDAFSRLRLIAHESFHRIQPELGHDPADALLPHLDEEQGRVWLRLEIRALGRAIATEGAGARAAVLDALLFRAARYAEFPGADSLERRLEGHEGLAEYTGVRFALDVTGPDPELVTELLDAFERRPTYVRSLGYGTGPALGLLLDRYRPGWRDMIGPEPDLDRRLARAVGAPLADSRAQAVRDAALQRGAAYGADIVRAEEQERAQRRAADLEVYRKVLVEGPTLTVELPDRLLLFNPNTVLPLGDEGNVYPGAILMGDWGRLTLEDGAALGNADRSRARVAAPQSPEPGHAGLVEGPGWTLELEAGWHLVPGDRPGDFRLARVDAEH